MRRERQVVALALFALSSACEPEPPNNTGAVVLKETLGTNGRSCGRGVSVVMSDYVSSNVALLDLSGETVSGSFVSSASSDVSLNAPLSGDVDFPSSRMEAELVLLDRFPTSVLTYLDLQTAAVTAQIPVRTGFDANPQDYVRLDEERALVSRFEKNRSPGGEQFDQGDDLLVIHPETGALIGRVELGVLVDSRQRVRPTSLVRDDAHVLVAMTGHDDSFDDAAPALIGIVDAVDLRVIDSVQVEGMKNCGGLAMSPSGARLATVCSGLVDSANSAAPDWSGLVVFRRSNGDEWVEERRVEAKVLGWGPFAFDLSFAAEDLIVSVTFGAMEGEDAQRPDRLVQWDLSREAPTEALRSDQSVARLERAFVLGGVLCIVACDLCFVADAGRGVVHRFEVVEGELINATELRIDSDIELPPRRLGWF